MTKSIRLLQDLPSWFDIQKYTECEKFSAKDWRFQFRARGEFSCVLEKDFDLSEWERNWPGAVKHFMEVLDRVKKNPILGECPSVVRIREEMDAEYGDVEDVCSWEDSGLLAAEKGRRTRGLLNPDGLIESVEIYDFVGRASFPRIDLKDQSFWDISLDDLINRGEDVSFEDETSRDKIHIKVDLRASDEAILEELKIAIPKFRGLYGVGEPDRKPTQRNIKKLAKYRVLAIYDLLVWSRLNDISMSLDIIARAVFPDGQYGENQLRQHIIPHLKKCLNYKFLRSIAD